MSQKNNPKLWDELLVILNGEQDQRLPLFTLERRMRGRGWTGWSSPHGWAPMLLEMGFHIYNGRNARNNRVRWVSAEPPPEHEPDEFERQGYVLATPRDEFILRSSSVTVPRFGRERKLARVWRDYGWAARYAREHNLVSRTEVASTRHLR